MSNKSENDITPEDEEHKRKMRQRYAAMAITLHSILREEAHVFEGEGPPCSACDGHQDSRIHMCPHCPELVPLGKQSICPACGRRA